MKTYVLIVSEKFPKGHNRSGQDTNFPLSIKHYDKIHTIRANYPLWKKRFEEIDKGLAILSVRVWLGKPYRSKQGEIFRYDKTKGIGIEEIKNLGIDNELAFYISTDRHLLPVNISELAKNDGLSEEDFKDWFSNYDLSKPMAIIHFTDFRYSR